MNEASVFDRLARLDSAAIHAGEVHDELGAHVSPIYQTSTFTFENMTAVNNHVAGNSHSYIYSRGGNPGREALANKLAALEGFDLVEQAKAEGKEASEVVAAEVFGSGMAAISSALLGMASKGDHVIAQTVLYGSSEHLIADFLPRYGISVSRLSLLDMDELARELEAHPNTRLVYLETPANPTMGLVDITAVSEIAHAHNALVVVDNTFATPVLQRPLTLGADVVVHSTTKYICGHGVVLGGAAIARDVELMNEHIGPMIRYFGGVPSPFDCWLTNLGLKTMPLRMRQHCVNGMAVAQFLEGHEGVTAVYYPGLESFPQHELAKRQMSDFGAMIAFEVKGGYDAAQHMLDNVKLCGLAVSLGNLDSLIEHPASMTHSGIAPEEQLQKGITPGLIRLSVGLELVDDIIADLAQALR